MLLPKIGVWSVKSLSKYQLQKLKISRSFSKNQKELRNFPTEIYNVQYQYSDAVYVPRYSDTLFVLSIKRYC